MSIDSIPCMGGWCLARVGCANYYATGPEPSDRRLCPKGQDWPEPIKVAGECPMCHELHTLSQCPRWRVANNKEEAL